MKTRTFKVGRRADNGKFCTVEQARQRHDTAVVETIKVPVKKNKK